MTTVRLTRVRAGKYKFERGDDSYLIEFEDTPWGNDPRWSVWWFHRGEMVEQAWQFRRLSSARKAIAENLEKGLDSAY